MSTYPSTATLAAFRRSLAPRYASTARIGALVQHDRATPTGADHDHADTRPCPVLAPECEPFAVFPSELRDGIGSQTGNAYGMQRAWYARHEAARMRSEAYERTVRHAFLRLRLGTAAQTFVPRRSDRIR